MEIAAGHEIRAVRLHAHAPDGETGETGALLGHRLEARDRHRLGLGRTVNIDELGQHILDAMLVDDFLVSLGNMGKASGSVAIIPLGNLISKRNASSLPTGHAHARRPGNPRLSSICRGKMLS
uniref:Uncharacterized protein n=1 Tax=Ectopseudomonas oleovorans TaxID=301 RepID=A0A653BCY6_ECTOL